MNPITQTKQAECLSKPEEKKVKFDNTFRKHNFNPKYLGIKLDSSFDFKVPLNEIENEK